MNRFHPSWPVGQINAEFNHAASLAASIGDLLYWDASGSVLRPASNLADLGSAAAQQASFARLFVGVSNSAQQASDATARPARVLVDGIYEFLCDSNTFAIGDLVGPKYTTDKLENQTVTKVTARHLAIGRVVKRYASATTRVKCRLLSRYLNGFDAFLGMPVPIGIGTLAAADADTTVTLATVAPVITMNPTANPRKLILPTESLCAGFQLHIVNLAAATNGIQVRDSGDAATVATIPAAKRGLVWCDGTTWYGGPFA